MCHELGGRQALLRWRGRFWHEKDAGGYELPKWKECEREEEKI